MAPLSIGFFQQEYWSGLLPFSPPRNIPGPRIKPVSQNRVSCIACRFFFFTAEPLGKSTVREEVTPILLKLFPKKLQRKEHSQTNSMKYYPDTKTRQKYHKKIKLQANITDGLRCKNPQHNISKHNHYIKKIIHLDPTLSGIYPGMQEVFNIFKSV